VVLGVVGVTAWREETVLTMEPGQTMQIAGMSLTYRGEFPKRGPNYRDSIGRFELLIADTVLAKHDETYMPREVADALKKKGVWQHSDGKTE